MSKRSVQLSLIATMLLLPLQLSPDAIDSVMACNAFAFTTIPTPGWKKSLVTHLFPEIWRSAVSYNPCTGALLMASPSEDHNGGGIEDNDQQQHHPLMEIAVLLADRVDQQICTRILHAGRAWLDKDWDGVTASLGEAADALTSYLEIQVGVEEAPASTTKMWQVIAQELQDISTIEGCSSVGPPASIPNWLAIQEVLQSMAAESSREDSKWMEDAAAAIDTSVEGI